jgi:hypothetical protein
VAKNKFDAGDFSCFKNIQTVYGVQNVSNAELLAARCRKNIIHGIKQPLE